MQRPSNMSLFRFAAAGLLAAVALAGASAPAMAMTYVPTLIDRGPMLGALSSDVTATIDLTAQPPGGAIQALEMTVHNTALQPAGADTEFISAAAAMPDNQLLRATGHVFDDWPVIGAQ